MTAQPTPWRYNFVLPPTICNEVTPPPTKTCTWTTMTTNDAQEISILTIPTTKVNGPTKKWGLWGHLCREYKRHRHVTPPRDLGSGRSTTDGQRMEKMNLPSPYSSLTAGVTSKAGKLIHQNKQCRQPLYEDRTVTHWQWSAEQQSVEDPKPSA